MTTTTFTLTAPQQPADRDYFTEGRADAYDQYQAGTPMYVIHDTLNWLLDCLDDPRLTRRQDPRLDYSQVEYAKGYGATYAALRLREEAVGEAETDLAYADHAAYLTDLDDTDADGEPDDLARALAEDGYSLTQQQRIAQGGWAA